MDEEKSTEDLEEREDIAIEEQVESMDDRIFNKLSDLYDTIDSMKREIDDRFDRVSKIMIDSGAVVREVSENKEEDREEYESLEDLDFTI